MLIQKILSKFISNKRSLQPEGRRPSRGIAPSGFRPLRNIPHCCLPQESGPCLSPSVADHPLKPARDRRLGKPLPYQLANLTWANQMARGPKSPSFGPQTLCGISSRFQLLSPTIWHIPKHYSPVRRSTPKYKYFSFPLDLHVLSLPPAFNLSHDQTLQLKIVCVCFHPKVKTNCSMNSVLSYSPDQDK